MLKVPHMYTISLSLSHAGRAAVALSASCRTGAASGACLPAKRAGLQGAFYTQFPSQDAGLFGPNPWNILAPPSNYISTKRFLGNPTLGTSLVRENIVMGTGCRLSTEVTFGRGDLSVCPLGGFAGAMNRLLLIGGVSPRGCPQGQH